MEYRETLFSKDGRVGRITLNRPQLLNALTNRVRYEVCMALEECGDDEEIRVVVIKGEGRAFSAGDDMRTARDPVPPSQSRGPGDVVVAMRNLLKPIISQVHGYAFGAGLEFVLGTDICIAAEGTQFCSPFVKRAMGYGGNMLPRFVGTRRATEMLFTGEPIDAQTALDWGLITRMVPADALEAEVERWADQLGAGATVAMGGIKNNLTRGWNMSVEDGYGLLATSNARASLSPDREEGRKAWQEKREPNFSGR